MRIIAESYAQSVPEPAPLGEFTYVGKGTPSEPLITVRDASMAESAPQPPSADNLAKTFCRDMIETLRHNVGEERKRRAVSLSEAERWLTWVKPFGPDNEPVYMFVSESTAVAVQKKTAWDSKGHLYANDDIALEDFIAVKWAWFTENPKGVL